MNDIEKKIRDYIRTRYLERSVRCYTSEHFDHPDFHSHAPALCTPEELPAAVATLVREHVLTLELEVYCPEGHCAWGGLCPEGVTPGDLDSEEEFMLEGAKGGGAITCWECDDGDLEPGDYGFRYGYRIAAQFEAALDNHKKLADVIEYHVDHGARPGDVAAGIEWWKVDPAIPALDIPQTLALIDDLIVEGRLIQNPWDKKVYVAAWYPKTIAHIKECAIRHKEAYP